ncbi:flagellin B [uncultured Photobacterium sp.]|uniref:flagellin N-terminal helical domain-containing protein n=1 Tax=uncultured Photobacterium sp. TaxID=173973 RepID=UPI002616D44A|nr:flagellin B [uncultured Photobacterium sp.]
MIVNSNPTAKLTQRYLHRATSSHADSMKKLASGSRINSAKDDAAGLQISNRLQAQRSGFEVAIRNASDATSMLQTAEGAMAEYTDNLMRMRDLTLQYANGVNSPEDHDAIHQEFNALKDELKRITETTSFGGQRLLNGTAGERSFQIGADAGEAIFVEFPDLANYQGEDVNGIDNDQLVTSTYRLAKRLWHSMPGDKVIFRDYTHKEPPLVLELDGKVSIEDLPELVNEEFGDKIRAYVREDNGILIRFSRRYRLFSPGH